MATSCSEKLGRFLDHGDNKSPYVSGGCQHDASYTIINKVRYSDYYLMDEVYSQEWENIFTE